MITPASRLREALAAMDEATAKLRTSLPLPPTVDELKEASRMLSLVSGVLAAIGTDLRFRELRESREETELLKWWDK